MSFSSLHITLTLVVGLGSFFINIASCTFLGMSFSFLHITLTLVVLGHHQRSEVKDRQSVNIQLSSAEDGVWLL